MNTATATSRVRSRAGRRIVTAIVAAAALGLGATACGPESDADAAGSSTPPASSSSQDPSASTPPADGSDAQGQNGGQSSAPPAADPAGSKAPEGGGAAQAGNHRSIVGKLEYLAPGKLIVKPENGGRDQAFFVANATTVLGAAAICSDDEGSVSIGDDGYGTSKCTVEQLEKAAKTGSVTVRVTMNIKSGAAETVSEKYHP